MILSALERMSLTGKHTQTLDFYKYKHQNPFLWSHLDIHLRIWKMHTVEFITVINASREKFGGLKFLGCIIHDYFIQTL
jgi:hypothetical protein